MQNCKSSSLVTYLALEPVLKRAARQFLAVFLTGPRQSDKTIPLERIDELGIG